MTQGNLFADLTQHLPDELFTTLLEAADVRIERVVSKGHASPAGFWYDQDRHEWVVVLKGAARLRFEDGIVDMRPGDFMNIPAHKRHRVEWTAPDEPTIWLAVHYGDQRRAPTFPSSPVRTVAPIAATGSGRPVLSPSPT